MALRTLCHLIFLLILLSVTWLEEAAAADPRPSYRSFDVQSGNRRFTARVFVADKQGGERPWQWRYRIQVSTTADHATQWEHDYVYDGHPGGDLSDDGRFFVNTSMWYRDSGQLVSIYHAQGHHHFSAADLGVGPTGAEGTRSPPLWLQELRFVNDASGAARFVLETVQGSRCIRLRPEVLVEDRCIGE